MSDYAFGSVTDDDEVTRSDEELSKEIEESLRDAEEGKIPTADLFEEMRKQLTEPAVEANREVSIPCLAPGRKGFEIIYNVTLPYERIERWMKSCTNKKTNYVDMRRFALMVIVATQVGIKFKGVRMTDPKHGDDLVFNSAYMAQITGQLDKIGVITWLYGKDNDGELLQVANRITQEAGYTELDFDQAQEAGDDPLV